MNDRVILGNGKSKMLKAPSDMPTDFATWRSQLLAGTAYVDVLANNATSGTNAGVSAVGTPLNKANLLADATATALGLGTDATINDALNTIAGQVGGIIPIEKGGTGQTTATAALDALGGFPKSCGIWVSSGNTLDNMPNGFYYVNTNTGGWSALQEVIGGTGANILQFGFPIDSGTHQSDVFQIAIKRDTQAMAMRIRWAGVWTAWSTIYTGQTITYSDTQPASPVTGQIWLKPMA